ncbi:SET domain-containing protein-lysine N-methyltransferase [Candidatus Woesearchaeota archaeon]|jgi:uncharacterized protein|nr:SET domain-containing protein-lysine N-methyltransferase [Candidatus Woesearchaeota archaeon]MBT6774914.1 SET domain-containing protein-lysine N-methyltransferase [Candidatus Woesearchaeota archaeon]
MEDIHDRWPHRWITDKAKSSISEVEGLGVFATEPIRKDELVAIIGGVIVPCSEMPEYINLVCPAGIQLNEDYFIVPTTRKELEDTGVFNHSCNPNVGFSGDIQLVAMKDICPGEELAFDYAFNITLIEDLQCKCGYEKCREIITKDDWKIKDIQDRYGQYFSPYLKKRL